MEFCDKCNGELYIKNLLEEGCEYWCPYCNGITPLDKEESIELCKEHINNNYKKSLQYSRTFSKDSLIFAAMNVREMAFKREPDIITYDLHEVIYSTMILKDCLNGEFNKDGKNISKDYLKDLFTYYNKRINAENLKVEIEEGYCSLFLESDKIQENFSNDTHIVINNKNYYYIFKSKWNDFLEALETVQVVPKIRLAKVKRKVDEEMEKREKEINVFRLKINSPLRPKIKERYSEQLKELLEKRKMEYLEVYYNSFPAIYYNQEMFLFKELKKDGMTSRFIAQLSEIAKNKISNEEDKNKYYEMDIEEFKDLCTLESVNFNEIYDMFVSSDNKFKEFPLVVEHNSKLLICPNTLFQVWAFVRYEFNKQKYKSELGLLGEEFELKTKEVFENNKFSLNNPKSNKQYLFRKKFNILKDGKNFTREFDIIAYNDRIIYVVDCKRNSLKPNFVLEKERKMRVFGNEGIIAEINHKHLDRVEYIDKNQNELGFKEKRKVNGLIVTLIKEDIDNYKGVDVISFNELSSYLKNLTQ